MNGRGVSSAPLAVVDVISSSASTKLIGTPSASRLSPISRSTPACGCSGSGSGSGSGSIPSTG
eukprot:COSAG04_NODE_3111_length_3158_cov_3.667865_2_plen_63_part_00